MSSEIAIVEVQDLQHFAVLKHPQVALSVLVLFDSASYRGPGSFIPTSGPGGLLHQTCCCEVAGAELPNIINYCSVWQLL